MNLKRHTTRRKLEGLTLIEVLVVIGVLVVIVMLLGLVDFGALSVDRVKAKRATCQNNLKQIDLAFLSWEGDHDDTNAVRVSTNEGRMMEWGAGSNVYLHVRVMTDQLNNPKVLICPADVRTPAPNFHNFGNSNLSYFVSLEADETMPGNILYGDRNLMKNGAPVVTGLLTLTKGDKTSWNTNMHNRAGNIALGDGSVQQVDDAGLQKYFQQSRTNVNRLAVP